jgi:hypothetical protein
MLKWLFRSPLSELNLNPTLWRYELQRHQPATSWQQKIQTIVWHVAWVSLLLLVGVLVATNGMTQDAGMNWIDSVWRVLIVPLLVLQMVLSLVSIALASQVVADERRRQTWDNLRITEGGITASLRVLWASVFYRLRFPLVILFLGRLVLALTILVELTAFRGGYLDLITANILPAIPVFVGIVFLSLSATVGILLPFTHLGMDIALGLLVAVRVQNRANAFVWLLLYSLFRVLLMGLPLLLFAGVMQGNMPIPSGILPDGMNALIFLTMSFLADWGLHHLHLSILGMTWALIPYSVFLPIILLVLAIVQAMFSDGLLKWAERSAEHLE